MNLLNEIAKVWAYLEPLLWLFAAVSAASWWLRRKYSLWRWKSRYEKADERTVVLVQVARDVEEMVARSLGQVDFTISWDGLLASESDYRKLLKEFMSVSKKFKGRVEIVIAGPLALAFLLGQEMGKYKSHVVVWQYTGGQYTPIDTWEVWK